MLGYDSLETHVVRPHCKVNFAQLQNPFLPFVLLQKMSLNQKRHNRQAAGYSIRIHQTLANTFPQCSPCTVLEKKLLVRLNYHQKLNIE